MKKMKISHSRALQLHGLMWTAIGCFLIFYKGFNVIGTLEKGVLSLENRPMIFFRHLVSILGSFKIAIVLWGVFCLVIGWILYKVVVSKIAYKKMESLRKKHHPLPVNSLLSLMDLIFLVCIVYSGEMTKLLYKEFRFLVFVAAGFSLILGGLLMVRLSFLNLNKAIQLFDEN
jgi:hypothetical protein